MTGADGVKRALTELMAMAKPSQRRKAIRAALTHVRRKNRARIRAQQNVDGAAYAPRAQNPNVGKTWLVYKPPLAADYNGDRRARQVYIGKLGRESKGRVKMTLTDGSVVHLTTEYIQAQRKIKKRRGKMLTGFAKQLQIKMFGSDKGVLNYPSGGARLARVHHFGAVLGGDSMLPARQVLGLSEEDAREALAIMMQVITETMKPKRT
jgi:hypothetical protein